MPNYGDRQTICRNLKKNKKGVKLADKEFEEQTRFYARRLIVNFYTEIANR